jgi:hypothetical protein
MTRKAQFQSQEADYYLRPFGYTEAAARAQPKSRRQL